MLYFILNFFVLNYSGLLHSKELKVIKFFRDKNIHLCFCIRRIYSYIVIFLAVVLFNVNYYFESIFLCLATL